MLLGSFYNILEVKDDVSSGKVIIFFELNPEHEIYKGHFPDTPVVPGACMVQILKENLSFILNRNVNLTKASDIKFLNVITPNNNNKLKMEIFITNLEDNTININCKVLSDETVCFKFKGNFR